MVDSTRGKSPAVPSPVEWGRRTSRERLQVFFRKHPKLWRAAAVLVLLAGISLLLWEIAPGFVDDPLPGLAARTPVRTWLDRNGIPLYCQRTSEWEWRFDVSLDEIAPVAIDFTIGVEDFGFWKHHGVDYLAVVRAFFQNIANFKVISGASTISMQIAAMDYHRGHRGVKEKILQAVKARKMEKLHTKEEILEAYFNNLPFGGNIYGIEAASRYYYGMHASSLSAAEASLLCGLPQAPNRYRPDRHPDAARKRQRRVLDSLARRGVIDKAEADRIFDHERLRYRDFSLPSDFQRLNYAGDLSFLIGSDPPFLPGDPQEVRLSIDSRLTESVRRILKRRVEALDDIHDAAAILVDARSGERLAYVGTLDFESPDGGQVDAAASLRSAGSVLKPFVYHEAICGGLLVADTFLVDAPVRYSEYAPSNYDGSFHGIVTASYALSRSLNTPAVRLLAELGAERVRRSFDEVGLSTGGQVSTNGLSLVLGTAGYRLCDMVDAYRTLVPRSAEGIGYETRAMLSDMLRSLPLPDCLVDVAWKTGTSNNNCDAWCFAYTPEYVIGVWFGNKSGKRAKQLVGAEVAAPAAGEIMESLYKNGRRPFWPEKSEWTRRAQLCSATGLRATSSCASTFEGDVLKSVPLRECTSCARASARIAIISPAPKTYTREAGKESVRLHLDCGGANVLWFLDGTMLPEGTDIYEFVTGQHVIQAIPLDERRPSAEVKFTIR